MFQFKLIDFLVCVIQNWSNLYFVFQVHYDLGAIFFQQGCTDQPTYQKARDHFRQTKELLKKVHLPEIA